MFVDWNEVPEWSREFVQLAVERGLISGYPDGTIRFNAPLTRGEYIVGQAKAARNAEELIDADRRELLLRIANAVVEMVDINFQATARKFFGTTLYTQGSPVGLSGALSRGIFSGIHYFGDFFLTYSGSINPGNSGGGIYDLSGKLVSIAVAKPNNPLVDGIGFGVVPLFIHRFLTT